VTRTVFVPLTALAARALRDGAAEAAVDGYADTAGLRGALDDPEPDPEDVGFLAQTHAGVAALLGEADAPRLVLAAEVDDRQVHELPGDLGAVAVSGLRWVQVLSLFAHDPAGTRLVRRAQEAVRGLDLAAALTRQEVAELLDGYDLLWYGPEELDGLSGAGSGQGPAD
jgi:hypothetical protein